MKRDFQLPDRHTFAIKKEVLAPKGAKGDSKMAGKTFLKTALTISLFFVVFAVAGNVHAKIIYVDDDAPANFSNIQAVKVIVISIILARPLPLEV